MRGFISYLDTNIAVVPLVDGGIPYLYCTRSKFVMPGLNEDEVYDVEYDEIIKLRDDRIDSTRYISFIDLTMLHDIILGSERERHRLLAKNYDISVNDNIIFEEDQNSYNITLKVFDRALLLHNISHPDEDQAIDKLQSLLAAETDDLMRTRLYTEIYPKLRAAVENNRHNDETYRDYLYNVYIYREKLNSILYDYGYKQLING